MLQLAELEEKYTFYRTRRDVLFVNYFDKYAIAILLFVSITYVIFDYPDSLTGIFFAFIIVIPILILFSTHFKKTAHKLIFDLKNEKVEFYMFRNQGVIITNIKEIERVHDGGDLTFYLKGGKKILWKKREDEKELIELLKTMGF